MYTFKYHKKQHGKHITLYSNDSDSVISKTTSINIRSIFNDSLRSIKNYLRIECKTFGTKPDRKLAWNFFFFFSFFPLPLQCDLARTTICTVLLYIYSTYRNESIGISSIPPHYVHYNTICGFK